MISSRCATFHDRILRTCTFTACCWPTFRGKQSLALTTWEREWEKIKINKKRTMDFLFNLEFSKTNSLFLSVCPSVWVWFFSLSQTSFVYVHESCVKLQQQIRERKSWIRHSDKGKFFNWIRIAVLKNLFRHVLCGWLIGTNLIAINMVNINIGLTRWCDCSPK